MPTQLKHRDRSITPGRGRSITPKEKKRKKGEGNFPERTLKEVVSKKETEGIGSLCEILNES